jgi:hypothetical protein
LCQIRYLTNEKSLNVFVFLIIHNFSLNAQDINLSKSDLEVVLCKQWKIEYALMGGMKIQQMPGAADFDLKFKSDGTYDLIQEDGTIDNGIWVFDSKMKLIVLSIKEKVTSRVKSINENKLILTLVSGQKEPPGLPNMEIHFKPL